MLQRIFLDLNAEIGDTGILSRKELTHCRRSDTQPVSGSELNRFTVNDGLALSGENAVNLFILLVGVDERNTCACRQLVDTDLCSGQTQLFVQFDTAFLTDCCFCIVFHDSLPPMVICNFHCLTIV
nr:MAG TPA: hypothetical protein [Caudoviricetes sp.]